MNYSFDFLVTTFLIRMNHIVNNIKLYITLILLVLTGILTACAELPPTPESSPPTLVSETNITDDDVQDNAYPSTNAMNDGYPTGSNESVVPSEAYPSLAAEEFREPRFLIDLPQLASNTIVTGQAPPDLSIAIVDVTFNGVVLGSGRSDESGHFRINVNSLQPGNRIGITFSELRAGQTYNDMAIEYFPHRGDGFMNIPNVGVFFDTTIVE